MRELMWFAIGSGSACVLCAYLLPDAYRWPSALTALLLAGIAWLLGRRLDRFAAMAVALLGFALGVVWFARFDQAYLQPAAALDGVTQGITIRVTDYSQETNYGTRVEGSITLKERSFRVLAYLDETDPLAPGDQIQGTFRCRVTTADGAENATYHQGKGIFMLLYQTGKTVRVNHAPDTWKDLPAKLRREIKQLLADCFPADTFPFAQALLLGDTGDLGYETDTDLKISGIRHVVAVSGLHVSILFALISIVTFRKRFLTVLLGLPALLLFAAVAGFTPSVTRACLMSGLLLAATLFQKSYDGPTALSFAVLVILAGNPLTITNAGFQLSVASVAGIYLFSPKLRQWLVSLFGDTSRKGKKACFVGWFSGSVSVTLGAMFFTMPLSAMYFGTVSLAGAVTNLLTLWVISFVFYGLIAVCLLALVWQSGATLLAAAISIPIRYVLLLAKGMADLPLAAVYTRSAYISWWLLFVYVLLAVLLISRRKEPWIFVCCVCLGLCAALLASWVEPLMDDVRLTVLDVGQGQCLLLQSQGRTYMVDCGGDRDTDTADIAAEELLSQGIPRLDGLIITHFDEDHAAAAGNLLSRVDTDLLILPPEPWELAEHTDAEVVYADRDMTIAWGNAVIHIFAADYEGSGNEKSLCILFDTEKCDILITGDRDMDGEEALLENPVIADVDVLIAGHHGSKYATSEALLERTRPETVCISVGLDNPYGHPAPELLERLASWGCAVYRTDSHGDIVIRR